MQQYADYQVILKNASGVRQALLTADGAGIGGGFRSLMYRKERNAPGSVVLTLHGDHPLIEQIAVNWQIEVRRRDPAMGVPWYTDFEGLFVDDDLDAPDDGLPGAQLTALGVMTMLSWRINAYPADTANKTVWSSTPTETIMKNLVSNNFGAAATTANGRDVTAPTGSIPGGSLSVQTNTGAGTAITWRSVRGIVLPDLQELSLLGNLDFDLISTGVNAWQFRTYTGQRGVDRTNSLTFAQEYGNLSNPKRSRVRSQEYTVAVVGGQGQEANRRMRTRTGPTYAIDRHIERLVNGSMITNDNPTSANAALDAIGDRALDAAAWRTRLSGGAVQTFGCRYGVQYCVGGAIGDRATLRFRGDEQPVYIQAVTIRVVDGRELIQVEFLSV